MNERFGGGAGALCKVCGDRASGKHYGVASCDGCRGFFKRSIRRNLEYICKEGGKCIVDVSRRNQCQACRFAKCLEANMRREAVQHERAPKMPSVSSSTHGLSYAANLYARHHDALFPFQMSFASPIAFPVDSYYMPSPYYPHLTESLNLKLNQSVSVFKPQLVPPSNYDLEIGKLINNNAIGDASKTREKDNEVSSSEEIPPVLPNEFARLKSKHSLYDSATKLLFLSIRWAKSIPSFHQLPLSDQRRLMTESWAELFVVAASQWGLHIEDEILETHPYLKRLHNFIKHFASLKIDHFEAACLKALILFRGNLSEDQTTSQQILLLQNQTLCLLIEKCGGLRFGHLLLVLPQIRNVGNSQSLQENLFKHSVGDVVIDKILGDVHL